MNGDGAVDIFDIRAFEFALANPQTYLSQYPLMTNYRVRGDASHNGAFDNFDIQPFEQLLAAGNVVVGDMDGDGSVNNFDIRAFELALVNPQTYLAQYPLLIDYRVRGDVNHDGTFDNFDIDPFERLLAGSDDQDTGEAIWISDEAIAGLPTSGDAWTKLLSAANSNAGTPNISDQDEDADVLTLAKALVGVRLNSETYLAAARRDVMAAIGTESDGRTLALGRNLASYVIAADLAGLSAADDALFRTWLQSALTEDLEGETLRGTHEKRPNNWGLMTGASRAAVAVYLGDTVELARVAQVFKGWLGDRTSYAQFEYDDLSWQSNPSAPVGINPVGATKEGHSIDGALPEEMRRGGPFAWPPEETNYPWGALQGAVVQAEILYRAGYDTWQWSDQAILRAVQFLYSIGWSPTGDDQWIISLVNARYGTSFAVNHSASPGKIMGWTAWTHSGSTSSAAAGVELNLELDAVALGVATQTAVSRTSIATPSSANSAGQVWASSTGDDGAAVKLTVEDPLRETTRRPGVQKFTSREPSAGETTELHDLALAEFDCSLAV